MLPRLALPVLRCPFGVSLGQVKTSVAQDTGVLRLFSRLSIVLYLSKRKRKTGNAKQATQDAALQQPCR